MSAGQEIGSPIREKPEPCSRRSITARRGPRDKPSQPLAGLSTVGLGPPFDTPAAAFSSRLSRHSHLDCRAALGLSICRSIIEEHGGRLWAGTNEPRGAIFQCTVPAHPDTVLSVAIPPDTAPLHRQHISPEVDDVG